MQYLTPQEKKAVLEFKRRVFAAIPARIVELRLFGSRARGEGSEESDIDILVLLKKESRVDRDRVFEIAADCLLEYEIDISPLVMSLDHFEDMKKRERLLPQEIERDGQMI